MRETRPVAVFVHAAFLNDRSSPILAEIMHAIGESGLYQRAALLRVGVVGTDRPVLMEFPEALFQHFGNHLQYEFPTIRWMQDWCRKNPGADVCYVHTKGVSLPDDRNRRAWRKAMLASVVWDHRRMTRRLEVRNTAGYGADPQFGAVHSFNWGPAHLHYGHFAGNFWWARSEYIARLADVTLMDWSNRFRAETWIGTQPDIDATLKPYERWQHGRVEWFDAWGESLRSDRHVIIRAGLESLGMHTLHGGAQTDVLLLPLDKPLSGEEAAQVEAACPVWVSPVLGLSGFSRLERDTHHRLMARWAIAAGKQAVSTISK
jgi:hypothetical protein